MGVFYKQSFSEDVCSMILFHTLCHRHQKNEKFRNYVSPWPKPNFSISQVDAAFCYAEPQLGQLKRLTDSSFPNRCALGGFGMMARKNNPTFVTWWNDAFDKLVNTAEYRMICRDLKEAHGMYFSLLQTRKNRYVIKWGNKLCWNYKLHIWNLNGYIFIIEFAMFFSFKSLYNAYF